MKYREARYKAGLIAAQILQDNEDRVKGMAANMIVEEEGPTPRDEEDIQLVFDQYQKIVKGLS